jgi:hypothetical protein
MIESGIQAPNWVEREGFFLSSCCSTQKVWEDKSFSKFSFKLLTVSIVAYLASTPASLEPHNFPKFR